MPRRLYPALDLSGKTLNGVEAVVRADPGFEITVDVALESLNKKGQ